MQDGARFEREALHRLPELLADLLDEPKPRLRRSPRADGGADAVAIDDHGREWVFEVKSSSAPGVVARAAEQLFAAAPNDAIAVLVVPYMTPAGARAAAERGVNWLDLSGNAHIRAEQLYISREGRPNAFPARGRPASAFAPRSARVARVLLDDPSQWWRQKDLALETGLDDGRISKIVRRLDDDQLLERRDSELRPSDRDLLLDAWVDAYRFDRHDVVLGHASGSGGELARKLSRRLGSLKVEHALTGLPAAWLLDGFATFRLSTIYVDGDPRGVAERLELRRNERGANVQLVGPDDDGVFWGGRAIDGVPVVPPVQAYLDLLTLPERAREAAEHLRGEGLLWPA
jgi:hypothetical protein